MSGRVDKSKEELRGCPNKPSDEVLTPGIISLVSVRFDVKKK
jgi:hypothetical protein